VDHLLRPKPRFYPTRRGTRILPLVWFYPVAHRSPLWEPQVYRGSNPGLALRLYLLLHRETSEEHKYLAGVRREKDAFERLIKEHAVSQFIIDCSHQGTDSIEYDVEYAYRFGCAAVVCFR
jgi:hypothetical protein